MTSPNLIPETSNPGRAPAGTLKLFAQGGVAKTVDPNGSQKTLRVVEDEDADFATNIAAYMALRAPYDGEPANYVAAVAATPMTSEGADYTVDTNKTVRLTAKVPGVLSTAPVLVITAAVATSDGANATLSIVSQNPTTQVVTIRPKTTAGAQSHAHIETNSADQLTVTPAVATAAAIAGDALRIRVNKGNTGMADATVSYTWPTIDVNLAVATGTAAIWTLTDAGTGANSLVTLTAPKGEGIDPTTWNAMTFESIIPNAVSQGLSIITEDFPAVKIQYATDANGDMAPISASTLAAALKNDLDDWSDLTWTVTNAVADGDWDSYNAPQAASTPGVVGAALTTSKNQTTAIATLIHAIGAGSGAVFSCTGAGNTGTGVVTIADNPSLISFTGGGLNSTIDTSLADLTTLLHDAPSTIIDCAAGAGLQTALLEATAGVTLTGGTNLVPAVPGTPATLGRIAVGFATGESTAKSVWTAMTEDPTTTQAGWVKTTTGS